MSGESEEMASDEVEDELYNEDRYDEGSAMKPEVPVQCPEVIVREGQLSRCSREKGHVQYCFYQSDKARENTTGPWPWIGKAQPSNPEAVQCPCGHGKDDHGEGMEPVASAGPPAE